MANLRSVEGGPSVRPNERDWRRVEAFLKTGPHVPDWTSFPHDAPGEAPVDYEIEHETDKVNPTTQAEIPVHHQRALGATPLFIDKRIVDPEDPKGIRKITSEVATVRPSSHTDRANTLGLEPRRRPLLPRHLGAHKGEIHKKKASGAREFVKPHQPRPELPPTVHVDRKLDEGGTELSRGGIILREREEAVLVSDGDSDTQTHSSRLVHIAAEGFNVGLEELKPEADLDELHRLYQEQVADDAREVTRTTSDTMSLEVLREGEEKRVEAETDPAQALFDCATTIADLGKFNTSE